MILGLACFSFGLGAFIITVIIGLVMFHEFSRNPTNDSPVLRGSKPPPVVSSQAWWWWMSCTPVWSGSGTIKIHTAASKLGC